MNYVYVLFSEKDKKFYIGFTHDLKRRINEHRCGKVHTTYRFNDCELIFFEAFLSEIDARRREKYFKTSKGKKALKIMLKDAIKSK